MGTIVKVALGIILAFVLMAGGCAALIGSSMDDSTPEDKAQRIIDDASEKPSPAEESTKEPAANNASDMTTSQANAVRSADDYLSMSGFSKEGLIEQLEFEGYSKADAKFAIKALKPDWNAEAAESAKDYVDMSGFSRSGLIEQLMFEGFTRAQAEYGADKAGL